VGYPGKCAHLHGHNGLVRVEFAGEEVNPLGILIDFDEIKGLVQDYLDREWDHKTILWEKDPLLELLKNAGERVFPMRKQPSAENMAQLIFEYIKERGLPIHSVKIWETPSSCAEYEKRE